MSSKLNMDTSQYSCFIFFSLKVLKDVFWNKIQYLWSNNSLVSTFNSFLIVGIQALKNFYKFFYFFSEMFKIYLVYSDFFCFFFLTFLRDHRKNCCSYCVLDEVLVPEYDFKELFWVFEQIIQIRAQ